MSEVTRYAESLRGGVSESITGDWVSYEDYAALKAERDALAAEKNWWKPERCPVTNRPFFLWLEYPSGGMVPTYGGPYDSYTIPSVDSNGEFCCDRYDHDEGEWVDPECLSIRLTDDREPTVDDAFANQLRAEELSEAVEIINEKAADYAHGTLEWEVCHWLAITLNRKAANLRKENGHD